MLNFYKYFYKVSTMKRSNKRLIMVFSDLIALPVALWSGYALRLSEWWPEFYLRSSWWLFLALPIVGVYVFMRLGLYRAVVRFMGAQAIWAVIKGVMLLAVFLWAMATLFQINPFPRSVPINFALAALVYVGGSRLLVRHYYHWLLSSYVNKDAVLIYGAGGVGVQLSAALSDGREYYPVGFIDDDESLWGSTIKGLPVYGVDTISKLIISENVKHILLAIPNVTNIRRKEILAKIENFNAHVQTVPSMPELLSGEASITQLREIQIEDLLGRDSVLAEESLLKKCIADQVVMVTGAGGSIGAELCRQVLAQEPKILLLFDINEYNLYQIEQELKNTLSIKSPTTKLFSLLGCVNNRERVRNILRKFSVNTIYHAAAYKHVPIVEENIIEGITNNVCGTRVIAEEADRLKINHFILISTDKAVRPTNIMGASKRLAELILQNLSNMDTETIFSMVRFGNVLGSSGSVVPLFRKQIQRGGPLTVTHKEITRYFMTISEAASLVIQAGSMAQGGDVFVLDMGEPVKIVDLAKRMVHLSGLDIRNEDNPKGDISIEYTGLRPGEKLYEELLVGDSVVGTGHAKIMKANEDFLSADQLNKFLFDMESACNQCDYIRLRGILQKAVVGYTPYDSIVDLLSDDITSNVVKLH